MYRQLVDSNDKAVQRGISRQVLDPDSRYYGGTIDPSTGIAWVNHTTGTPTDMCYWGAAIANPDSIFYRDEDLLNRLQLASEYVLRNQHGDGSISPVGPIPILRRILHFSSWDMPSYISFFSSRIGSHCNLC